MKTGFIFKVVKSGYYIDSKEIFCPLRLIKNAAVGDKVEYEVRENTNKNFENKYVATKVRGIPHEGENSNTASECSELSETDLQINSLLEKGSIPSHLISNISYDKKKSVDCLGKILAKKGRKKFPGEKKADNALTITQVRNFYHSFQQIYDRKLETREAKISLLMLKANIEYTARRKCLRRFAIMMHSRIDILVKCDDADFSANLEAFKLHFEAFVAYFPRS